MSNLKMEEVLSFILKNAEYGNPQSVLDTIDDFAMNGALDKKRFLMNVGPEKGLILKELINKHEPKRVLELGAFIGYSAVLIAMTIKTDGSLVSIDPDPNSIITASKVIAHAQLTNKVTFIKEKAQDAIDDLDTPFDFIFIDHAKKRYLPDLLLLEKARLVKKDTIVFADNVGLFKNEMTEYFRHVRDSGLYTSKNIEASLEYRNDIFDAVEISKFN